MTEPPVPTPGQSTLTVYSPVGKVTRPYADEPFLATSSERHGTDEDREHNRDFEDPSASKDELQLDVNNDYGGVRGPTLDPTQFQEVRWGVVIRDNLSGDNELFIGFWDTIGAPEPNTSSAYIKQETDQGTAQYQASGGGGGTPKLQLLRPEKRATVSRSPSPSTDG